MIVAATHHRINRRGLFFACIRVVRVIARDDEVVHFFFENLLTSTILDVASRGTGAVLTAHIIFLILDAVFHAKVGVPVKLLATWAIFITCAIEYFALLRHNSHWIYHHCKVFFEVR